MTINYDVVGVGHAIVDVLAKVEESFLDDHNLPKGSMQLIEEEQADRLYETLPAATEMSGGSAANTTAAVASLGGRAAFIGKVKDDQLGQIFRHDINSIGVKYNTPASKSGASTARSIVSVTPDAERTMSTYLGAARDIKPEDINEEIIRSSRVVYFEGYLWDEADAKDTIRAAIDVAEKNEREIAFSLSDLFCVERHRNEFLNLIDNHVDILFGNEDEMKALMQENELNSLVKKMSSKCKIVALTRGPRGSVVISDQVYTIPARKGINVVDTTGAGDLYAGGFLYGYTQNMQLESCGNIGSIAAGEIISHMGARPQENLAELVRRAS